MTEAQKAKLLADFNAIKAGMSADAAALLQSTFDGNKTGGRSALKDAVRAVRKKFRRHGDAWGKRSDEDGNDDGDEEGDEDREYTCNNCDNPLSVHACGHCGAEGPGKYCSSCGRSQRDSCQGCGRYDYDPKVVDDDAEDGRAVAMLVAEQRMASKEKGVIRLWGTSSVKDKHGTVIKLSESLRCMTPTKTQVDVEHNFIPVKGCRIAEVAEAQRNWKDPADPKAVESLIDGASVEIHCDMSQPPERHPVDLKNFPDFPDGLPANGHALYDDCRSNILKGGSTYFRYAQQLADKVAAGDTDTIDKLHSIPFFTLTTDPSNTPALISEMRSKRSTGEIPPGRRLTTPAKPASDNPLASLESAVADDPAKATPATPTPAAAGSPALAASAAGGAPNPDISAVMSRLDALEALAVALRAAPQSKDLEASLKELLTKVEQIGVSLQTTRTEITADYRSLIKKSSDLTGSGYRRLKDELTKLTARPERIGHSGVEDELAADERSAEKQTPEERQKDIYLQQLEQFSKALA